MPLLQDPFANVADPYDMEQLVNNPDVSGFASMEQSLKDVLWVEGDSDKVAIQNLLGDSSNYLDVNSVGKFRGISAKEMVLVMFRTRHNDGLHVREYFSVDRDMDNNVGVPLVANSKGVLFYQMCYDGRNGGFNDLECFLYTSSLFKDYATKRYGISEGCVNNLVAQAIRGAAFVGAFRSATRKVREKDLRSVLNYWISSEDSFEGKSFDNFKPHSGEVNPRFFLEANCILIKAGKVLIDRGRALDAVRKYCDGAKTANFELAMEIAEKNLKQMSLKHNEIDFCRGHDLTYFIAKLVNSIDVQRPPRNCRELETALGEWLIWTESNRKRFGEELRKVELFRTFLPLDD